MALWTRIMIILAVLIALPFYWLLIDARTDPFPPNTIDIGRLRQAAQDIPGARPISIEYTAVAVRRLPGALLVAGGGLKQDFVGSTAFRLVTPGGDTVIDSGLTEQQAREIGFKAYNPQAQRTVDQWMQKARIILFTHEHADHIGGFLGSPAFPAIARKAVITPEMLPGIRSISAGAAARLPKPLVFGDYAAVAPGVVLLHTPGHTPAAQMIYVQLQNGREYLFTGDTASMRRNISWQRPRSRLMTDWVQPENRNATISWIKGLAALQKAAPRLTLVYSHDLTWLQSKRGPGFATGYVYEKLDEDADRTDERDEPEGDRVPTPGSGTPAPLATQ